MHRQHLLVSTEHKKCLTLYYDETYSNSCIYFDSIIIKQNFKATFIQYTEHNIAKHKYFIDLLNSFSYRVNKAHMTQQEFVALFKYLL